MIGTQYDMQMFRGDTLSFQVTFHDIEATSIANLYFTAKRNKTDSDEDALFQTSLENGGIVQVDNQEEPTYFVRVDPDMTEEAAPGKYFYDFQVNVEDDVYTVLYGSLKIEKDVTGARR